MTVLDTGAFLPHTASVNSGAEQSWSLQELAAETGVPARTIRFYIARGLLAGPAGAGRGAAYGGEHLVRLQAIRKLQAKGLMLAEIARAVSGGKVEPRLPAPSAWWSYPVADDVVLCTRAGLSPWRTKQVRAALADMVSRLAGSPEDGEKEDHGNH